MKKVLIFLLISFVAACICQAQSGNAYQVKLNDDTQKVELVAQDGKATEISLAAIQKNAQQSSQMMLLLEQENKMIGRWLKNLEELKTLEAKMKFFADIAPQVARLEKAKQEQKE